MKILTKENFIAKGRCRSAYLDPDDETKCIKVIHNKNRKKCFNESQKEEYYFKLIKKKNPSTQIIPRFYGREKTNEGDGLIFELVRDFDGNISKSLKNYFLNEENFMQINNPVKLLKDFKKILYNDFFVIDDLRLDNILYKKISPNNGYLIIIDGLANSEFIPISNYFEFFRKKKILRKFDTFDEILKKFNSSSKSYMKIFQNAQDLS